MKFSEKLKDAISEIYYVKFEPIPEYGDLMPLDDFVSCCECHGFVDGDGSGNYAFIDKMSDVDVSPSDIMKGNIDKRFTHVVWFNK